MKVIAYMAITPNGFIATPEGNTDWVSPADWDNYKKLVKQTGVVIVGRGTYDAMVAEKSFPLPDALNVVMTSHAPQTESLKNVAFEDRSPEEVLSELDKMGYKEAVLGGGGELLGSFIADGLVDELYLTVEPVLFGAGVPLCGFGDFTRRLTLLGMEKTAGGEVRLHYAVERQAAAGDFSRETEED